MTKFTYDLIKYDLSTFPLLFKGNKGIYLWTNKINGKRYVGSSGDMWRRVGEYLNINRLIRELARGESLIYRAMIKYGYNSFTFTLLETVNFPNGITPKEEAKYLEEREQKYLDEIKPEYNLLKTAGSNKGFIMSREARNKISVAKRGKPSHRKGATISAISRELSSKNSAMSKKVYVYSSDKNLMNTYTSITSCAEATGISRFRIARNIDTMRLLENQYFTSVIVFT